MNMTSLKSENYKKKQDDKMMRVPYIQICCHKKKVVWFLLKLRFQQ